MNPSVKITDFRYLPYQELNEPFYFIVLLDGNSRFSLDFTPYECKGRALLFLSPYQLLKWEKEQFNCHSLLKFHGDYYCIEFHKEEVACNGILFNNIFEEPFISVNVEFFQEILLIFDKINYIEDSTKSYDISLNKSYLQLILAKSSREKQILNLDKETIKVRATEILNFNTLLDNHFLEARTVHFYADKYNLSVDTFSKKIKKHYGKPPTKLIQERLILEAKKKLHLTYKSIKEISNELGFEDEFYFSRFFKKEVGISPKIFRETVGISIVAK